MNKISAADKEIFKRVIDSVPKIEIEQVTPDGEVSFAVALTDFGLTKEKIIESSLGNTKFFANFAGEMLVRGHMDMFAGILLGLDTKAYDAVVTSYQHENFGMFISREKIKFQFHISLIEDILNEDVLRLV